MNSADLISRYPQVYHMAEPGGWPSIVANGLLSTSALLDLYGVTGADRQAIESQWRPEKVTISSAGLPPAVIRDQKPIRPDMLAPCLKDGLSVADWYRLINSKVFFWAGRTRLHWLLGARAYRGSPHLVITLRTQPLLDRYERVVALSQINSGSAYPTGGTTSAPLRGRDTFLPIAAFPSHQEVAELLVETRVEDIATLAVSAEIWVKRGGADPEMVERVWSASD